MTIDTEKLRALHAATTQGEWLHGTITTPLFQAEYNGVFAGTADNPVLFTHDPRSKESLPVKGTYTTTVVQGQKNREFIADAHNIFPALLDEIEGLRALNNTLWQQNNRQQEELFEARNNDRIAMSWLADCKRAAGYEGDLPGLVAKISDLRCDVENLERNIEVRNEVIGSLRAENERYQHAMALHGLDIYKGDLP